MSTGLESGVAAEGAAGSAARAEAEPGAGLVAEPEAGPGAAGQPPSGRAIVRAGFRRYRWPLAVVSVILLGALAISLMIGSHTTGTLDADSPTPDGSQALANLMRDRGYSVVSVHSTDDAADALRQAGADSTLLVTDPGSLRPAQLDLLAAQRAGRLVLVEPTGTAAGRLAPDVTVRIGGFVDASAVSVAPECADADAGRAGTAELNDGVYFVPGSGAGGCYPNPRDGSEYLMVTAAGPVSDDTVLVGSATPFRNDHLAADGDAALTMQLLGKHRTIVWYRPDAADPQAVEAPDHRSFWEVIPDGWHWATLMMVFAVLLLAVYQGRRMGPIVAERLPVVVRAAETVEGRARLYQRAQVRDGAAAALREAARHRMAVQLGLPRTAAPAEVATTVAARGGRPSGEVLALLAGGVPADDPELVRLAAELDRLAAEVGRL